jgi:hypothetical protein
MTASSNRKTVRLDGAETFRATSPHASVQHVMWHHLAGTNCRMCVPNQTPVHAVRTYDLENLSTPRIVVYYST